MRKWIRFLQGGRAAGIQSPASTAVVPARLHACNKAQATPSAGYIFRLRSENTIVNKTKQNPLRDNERVAKMIA
jgi:hypothetical protein